MPYEYCTMGVQQFVFMSLLFYFINESSFVYCYFTKMF